MSRDQKPKPIRAVTVAGAVPVNEQIAVEASEAGSAASAGEHQASGNVPTKPGFPLVPAIFFLLACLLGGAGLTALPHVMPEMAGWFYGVHR